VATNPPKQSKLKKITKYNYIESIILIIIAIGGMLSFWFGIRAILRTEDPFSVVVTESMVPTLNVGDFIVVQGYANLSTIYAAPKPHGDIIVFWHRIIGRLVHRAIGETIDHGKRYLITRGDANSGSDSHYNLTGLGEPLPGLPEEYVIGKVIASAPVIGYILLSMQTLEGRIIIIALIVVLIVVEFVPFSEKKDKEQVQDQEQVEAKS